MDRLGPINVDRVRWCSEDFGISPEELADHIHVAPTRWNAVMEGREGLTFGQLRSMAEFFGRGVLFFLEQGAVTETQVRTPAFRSLTNDQPSLSPEVKIIIERAERYRDTYLAILEEVGEEPARPFKPPAASSADLATTTAKVRSWLGLNGIGTVPRSFDYFREKVEQQGILVIRTTGYLGAWRFPPDSSVIGFVLPYQVCPVILVRGQPAEPRMTFTLMHELGHLLLHRNGSIDREADLWARQGKEREANAFAGEVLVPDSQLNQIPRNAIPADVSGYDDALRHWYGAWGVSAEVVLRRLLDSGRLTVAQYEAYRSWRDAQPKMQKKTGGNRKGRFREPVQLFGRPYVRAVLTALRARRITLNKASGFLDNLKVNDVFKLEKHLAGL
jgi:Zn-dependent peptidase ImmA (M78 family)